MLALAVAAFFASPADWPQTRAERTNFAETSHYEDVVAFIHALQTNGAPIRLVWMGESTEGNKMPLVIASRPPMTAEMARRSGRPIIYIQANIHAGEVEGKEAAQALLREWSKTSPSVLDKAVVLMTPIYNIDGNEKFGPVEKNRPEQDGPGMVGLRPNGQNFDLNRDCIKAESPEMRGVLEYVYNGWDPDVVMDLHTTDGTRHGFELTYSPPLDPNSDPGVLKYTRDELLPQVRSQIRKLYGIELFDYGNAEGRTDQRAWRTFEPYGRYVTNYAGLRNRIGILSEATTFIPFKARVIATEQFVRACVDHVLKNSKKVLDLTRSADNRVVEWGLNPAKAPALGVRFEMDQRGTEAIPLEKLAAGEQRPLSGRPKVLEPVKMPVYDRFKASKTAAFPAAYALSPSETEVVALLRRHGVRVERLVRPWSGSASVFNIASVNQAQRPFQGKRLITLEGSFHDAPTTLADAYLVRTAQPLGVLAFTMLEPEGQDGAMAWGFFKAAPVQGGIYPVVKLMTPPLAVTEVVK